MPTRSKHKTAAKKTATQPAKGRPTAQAKPVAAGASEALAKEFKRLAEEVETIKAGMKKLGTGGQDTGASRRDQDKVLADRLARLDEKIESLWGRVADLEEHIEGEPVRGREADFEDAPERDFFER